MSDLTSGRDLVTGPVYSRQEGGPRERPDGARLGMDYTPPPRRDAFKQAGRHTARVRFLRRAMIIGSALLVSVLFIVAYFNPFRHLGSMSIGGVGIEGTKVTMDAPNISGVQQGGGSYVVKASQGIQDMTNPSELQLVKVNAKIGMADKTTTRVLSDTGIYNNKVDTMTLIGNVNIHNTSGYVLHLKSALIQFREGTFSSKERLKVDLQGGTVAADGMQITNNGHFITFTGNVESTFDAPSDEPSAAPPAADAPAPTSDAGPAAGESK